MTRAEKAELIRKAKEEMASRPSLVVAAAAAQVTTPAVKAVTSETSTVGQKVRISGLSEFQAAMAIMEAGGSDNAVAPQSVVSKAYRLLGSNSSAVVVDGTWVALRGVKGVTLYHFYAPVQIV